MLYFLDDMDKPYFIELTNRLYRITFLFPTKEPLRHKIREVGDEILANLVLILEGEIARRREAAFQVERDIEILDTLLELSRSQNWVDSDEIKKTQEKYREIKVEVEEFNDILRRKSAFYEQKALLIEDEKKFISKEREERTESIVKEKPVVSEKKKKDLNLNDRQKKIMELLGKKEKLQVKDFQDVLPSITKRTLRRDLVVLTDSRLVRRSGSGNMTSYSKV